MIYELNSVLKACLTAGFFPFILLVINLKQKSKETPLSILLPVLFGLIFSFIFQNRTVFICCLLSSLLWNNAWEKIKNRKLLMGVLCLVFLVIILIKWNSSLGRLFIWKISILHTNEFWLNGIGWENFRYYYAHWQMEWFLHHSEFGKFHWVADCPQYAFNEYLQVLIEAGIIGLLLLFLYTVFIVKRVFKSSGDMQKAAALSCLNILVFCLVSYPLHSCWVFCLLITSTSIVVIYIYKGIVLKGFVILILSGILTFEAIKITSYFQFKSEWIEASKVPDTDFRMTKMASLNSNKNKSADFVQYLAMCLIADSDYVFAKKLLLENSKKMNQYNVNLYLGEIYKNSGDLHSAILYYIKAHFIIPNRLLPSYNLMELYEQLNKLSDAKKWKNIIISTPVKIKSYITESIKQVANSRKYDSP